MIVQEGDKYVLYDRNGKALGKHKSRAQAETQERTINASKRTKVRKRLSDIRTFEIAGVREGANRGRFITMKESQQVFDLSQLEKIQSTLSRTITVLKSGVPSGQVIATLRQDLDAVYANFGQLLDKKAVEQAVRKPGSAYKLAQVLESLKGLSDKTKDLFLKEELDQLQSSVEAAMRGDETEETEETEVAPDDAQSNQPESTDTQEDNTMEKTTTAEPVDVPAPTPEAEVAAEVAAPVADLAPTTAPEATPAPEAAPAPTPEATPAPAPEAAPVPVPAPALVAPEVVTKADFEAFKQDVTQSLATQLAELTKVLKSSVASYTAPASGLGATVAPADNAMDWSDLAGLGTRLEADPDLNW